MEELHFSKTFMSLFFFLPKNIFTTFFIYTIRSLYFYTLFIHSFIHSFIHYLFSFYLLEAGHVLLVVAIGTVLILNLEGDDRSTMTVLQQV